MQAIHRTVLFCLVTVLYALDSFLCYLDPKLSGLLTGLKAGLFTVEVWTPYVRIRYLNQDFKPFVRCLKTSTKFRAQPLTLVIMVTVDLTGEHRGHEFG
jgi:hypothetical protein